MVKTANPYKRISVGAPDVADFNTIGANEILVTAKKAGTTQLIVWDDNERSQVVDEPTSYRELTVTAMTTAAMARGVRLGWIDRATFEPVINRGWTAVAARVNADGTVKDVCSGTGAQPTKEYYLNRHAVNGADDRGGAMALLASIEMELFRRSR